jgi:hypothetical protein
LLLVIAVLFITGVAVRRVLLGAQQVAVFVVN